MEFLHTLLALGQHLQAWLTHLLIAYPLWSGALTALIVAAEFIPVSGNLVPGAALLAAGGGLAAAGKVSLAPMLLGGTVGAVIGTSLFYHLAWALKEEIWHWRLWHRHQATVTRSREFFARYGIWAVIGGRFIPGVRVLVGILAGANGMPQKPFYLANVVGAFLWVASHIWVGYYGLKIFN